MVYVAIAIYSQLIYYSQAIYIAARGYGMPREPMCLKSSILLEVTYNVLLKLFYISSDFHSP